MIMLVLPEQIEWQERIDLRAELVTPGHNHMMRVTGRVTQCESRMKTSKINK